MTTTPHQSILQTNVYLLIAIFALTLTGCNEKNPTHQHVTLSNQTFNLELALTDAQIEKGLMERESLADDGGMLFVFPNAQVRHFWMKNCLIPIDIIYLDPAGRIVAIQQMLPPDPNTPENDLPLYSSRWPAQFAIEIEGDKADKLGLKIDQIVKLPLEYLKNLVH